VSRALERVSIIGAGKVGQALARAGRRAGLQMRLHRWRKGVPRSIDGQLLVVAVRDSDIAEVAVTLVDSGRLSGRRARLAAVHCAGAHGPELLAPLRAANVAVGQFHPLVAFADGSRPPSLAGATARITGDSRAVKRATQLARRLGMRPRSLEALDPAAYHAAAALLANGAAGLAAAARELLGHDLSEDDARAALGPLLRSVADNVATLGLPDALTGPVRRGDATAVRAHLEYLAREAPAAVALYRSSALAQLPLARSLGEADTEAFDEIEKILSRA
jgi:predicted short-subunit dehydrogenase-like oxidoreductase (DUF2520 family)